MFVLGKKKKNNHTNYDTYRHYIILPVYNIIYYTADSKSYYIYTIRTRIGWMGEGAIG